MSPDRTDLTLATIAIFGGQQDVGGVSRKIIEDDGEIWERNPEWEINWLSFILYLLETW